MAKSYSRTFNQLVIEVIETGAVNTALLSLQVPEIKGTGRKSFLSHGQSEAFVGDDYDAQLGYQLALANALTSMGAQLRRNAMGVVKQRDDIKARKATKKAGAVVESGTIALCRVEGTASR